jgi:hypothetical protein
MVRPPPSVVRALTEPLPPPVVLREFETEASVESHAAPEVRPWRPVASAPEQEESSIVVAPEFYVPTTPVSPPPVLPGWGSPSDEPAAPTGLGVSSSLSETGVVAVGVASRSGMVGRWGWGAIGAAAAAAAAVALLVAAWLSGRPS